MWADRRTGMHQEGMDTRKDHDLRKELLDLIKDVCNYPDPISEDFPEDAPLLGPESPLGLDSLDAMEISLAIQKRYGLRMDARNTARMVLVSLKTLERFVKHRGLDDSDDPTSHD